MSLAESHRQAWLDIVELAYQGNDEAVERASEEARIDLRSLFRKVNAIRACRDGGMHREDIERMGQRMCLGLYEAEKNKQKGPVRQIGMKLPTDLADLFEEQKNRLCAAIGVNGWQGFVEWLLPLLAETSDAQARHLAGCQSGGRQK